MAYLVDKTSIHKYSYSYKELEIITRENKLQRYFPPKIQVEDYQNLRKCGPLPLSLTYTETYFVLGDRHIDSLYRKSTTTNARSYSLDPSYLVILTCVLKNGASQMAQAIKVKNPPAIQETRETRILYLGQEDPLEEEMATQSTVFAWRIPHGQKNLVATVYRVTRS